MSEHPWQVELKNGSNTRVDDVVRVGVEAAEDVFQLDDAHGVAFIAPLSSISYAKRIDAQPETARARKVGLNRYVRDGILSDARQGKAVAVIQSAAIPPAVFADFVEAAKDAAQVSRSYGRERIYFEHGAVSFLIADGRVGGFVADVVYVIGWNELTEPQRKAITASVAARGGEVVRDAS